MEASALGCFTFKKTENEKKKKNYNQKASIIYLAATAVHYTYIFFYCDC